jgi:hypothetical protein
VSDGLTIRVTGAAEVVAALDKATSRALPEVAKVLGYGANKIKKDARSRVRGLAHAPAYPYSIGYDVFHGFGTVEAEIGPDKNRRQGALGNLIEYGSVNNAPIPHLAPALDAEEPHFVRALEDLVVRMLD